MATYRRMGILFRVVIGVAAVGIVYYRVFRDHLMGMATNEFSGPFSSLMSLLDTLLPIALAIILLGTVIWTIAGGVQEERSVMRGGRRRP